jgi:membrane-associated phospholipid phosphatase
MVVLLAVAGFATYALFPAVPPWLASVHGNLPPTDRVVPTVWATVHWANVDAIFETGSRYANDVAAMPSLHAAYSLLVVLFLWDLVPARLRPVRPVVALYPLAMGFALVYGAEHYVVDIVAGWAYAIAAYVAVSATVRCRAQSRSSA